MALLASCWLIVESFVVPHGFLKWFYLSFYINPVFLVFCQVFLWLKELLIYFFYPLTSLILLIFGLLRRVVVVLFFYVRPTRDDVYYDAFEPDFAQIVVSFRKVRIGLYSNLDTDDQATEGTSGDSCVTVSWLNDYLFSDHYTSTSATIGVHIMSESIMSNESINEVALQHQHKCTASSSFSFMDNSVDIKSLNQEFVMSGDDSVSPDYGVRPSNQKLVTSGDVQDVDAFHRTYTSRVRFFNILYHERLHGINAILNEHLSTDYPMQRVIWSRMAARKSLLRSLECDLEMIGVGQSCLFWEALNHQIHNVESLALSDDYGNIRLDHNVSRKFQQVEILLTRFVEDEKCEFKGSSSNTSKRLCFQSFLQIPDVTEFVLMEEENKMSEDYCMRPSQLLEVMYNCINAFWSYIKTDDKKSFWKYKSIWRAHSPVEDPLDLELLYDVAKNLHKKEKALRNMQGKSKCWMRRKLSVAAAGNEGRNLLVAMIDVKLVQMILKMSLINRSHLKWCQEKLDNIDFKQDIVFRGRISQLFPTS